MSTAELNAIFDKFLSDNNGKKIERVDPSAYAQCFDLAIYWMEYLGFPQTIFSGLLNAHEIFDKWSNPQFDRIPNTGPFVPQKGDICIWSGGLNGGVGHVAIATGEGDVNHFKSLDQNWVLGSPSVVVDHNYGYFLGVQRYKVTNSPQPTMQDRRPYWFDLLNSVIWNKPKEQITDDMVNQFVRDYPSQKYRSGLWDQLCNVAGFTGDTNQVSVAMIVTKLKGQGFDKAGFIQKIIDFMKSL